MDLYSRKIVGFHMDERMTKSLVIKALDQAYRLQKPCGEVLHHSDRGSQYASLEYQERLKTYRMKGSMNRKGCCYDNACIEFRRTLKLWKAYRRHCTSTGSKAWNSSSIRKRYKRKNGR
uniref:DDE-type integrase/transposase/recombinase n=1 Tax=Paenibacillus naphthalenovorans TaxID=162209 RepID=UPI0010F4A508